MHIDGHEQEDIVEYHTKFVNHFMNLYIPRMSTWDNNGNETPPMRHNLTLDLQGQAYKIILVTHDESTFYVNDQRKMRWIHKEQKNVLEKKGQGPSIMVSDFLTSEWGRLTSKDGTECV